MSYMFSFKQSPPSDPGAEPNMGTPGDMGDMGGGMDSMGMGGGFGMGGEEEQKTSTEIGRIYEVRKLYHRMTVLNNFLRNNPDNSLEPIKKIIGEAYDILNIVINNIKSFKDKIDDVITKYYRLVERALLVLEKHYKDKSIRIT